MPMTTNTGSLPLSQQQGIRQKQLQLQKARCWILLLMKQVATRKADGRMKKKGKILNKTKKKKKKKTIGTDFMALNHPLRTNHEAQVNISKSFEKDILCMVDVAKVQAY